MIQVTERNRWQKRVLRVATRRDLAKVKPEAEQIDGKVFTFLAGWPLTEDDTSIYVGEWAMVIQDPDFCRKYPDAPVWIASGDLEVVEPTITIIGDNYGHISDL